jgi:two-component system cell cycle sensor histidine kinase/response regulator CckA
MEAVGTLAGGIAHDFNNVLTAIIGFSDLLLQTHKPGNPSYAHILSIKSSANRAAGLVRQLLAFSRRQTLQPKVLQMGDVLTDLSMLMNRLLGEKIELKIVSGRDLWFVRADPSEIERTIINLAVNARDAMLPRGGRLTVRTRNIGERESQRLEAHGVARGEYVMIEVEDTGTGMTPEVMAKIFDPFFTTKAIGKGTGLGLASVYGIIKQTGGYIFPESTPGVGTVFRMLLPRYHVEPEEERAAATAAATAKPRARDLTGSGRVLLVEDEDAVRRFAVAALKSKGYEVLQAADGIEALEVMKAHDNRVDLVVSDVIMPEMDGPTLLKELRKVRPELKFIFVSGYPDEAFKNNLDPEAEFVFLPKPYSLAQIAAKVKEVIGR